MIVIVMGVSGAGKSTLAARLAERTGWSFAEGDDYHPEANKAKMAAGIALTDEDRLPWLDALRAVVDGWQREGRHGILTCSALKESYRERLAGGIADLRFVWLDPSRLVLEDRLAHRAGHYMNPNLLGSQLATLEPPQGALRLAGDESSEEAVAKVLNWIGFQS